MRVLLLVSTAPDSGIYTYSHFLAEQLKAKGITVDMDLPRHISYDIIHVQNAFPTNLLAARTMFPTAKIIYTTQMTESELMGMVPEPLIWMAKSYLKILYRASSAIISSSPKITKELTSHSALAKKVFFIPGAIDTTVFAPDADAGKKFRAKWKLSGKVVASVASIHVRKGIFDFAEISRQLPQYTFMWIGKIPDIQTLERKAELEELVKHPPSNLLFPGVLSQKELVSAYNAADLFLFPSYAETFGFVTVEAACCGLPVLIRGLDEHEMFSDFAEFFSSNEDCRKKAVKILEDSHFRKSLCKKYLDAREKYN